jgi:hypothetical protein
MPYPLNPTTGDEYILGSKTWKYNGSRWVKLGLSQTVSTNVAFSDLTSTPTTLAGYGITDGAPGTSESAAVGTVIYHSANTPPTDFIKANGAAISRTTYADLFAAIGTTFGTGDGSSTFNVPDLRGEFPRGWDDSRGIDNGRAFGSTQVDTFKEHKHLSFVRYQSNYAPFPYGHAASNGWNKEMDVNTAEGSEITPYNSPVGDDETRPRNIALLACIKYQNPAGGGSNYPVEPDWTATPDETYTTSGTWNKPASISADAWVYLIAIGAGGGGGSDGSINSSTGAHAGSGGGQGGGAILAAFRAGVFDGGTITIGAGGNGGAANTRAAGSDGGTTSLTGTGGTSISAGGGAGGYIEGVLTTMTKRTGGSVWYVEDGYDDPSGSFGANDWVAGVGNTWAYDGFSGSGPNVNTNNQTSTRAGAGGTTTVTGGGTTAHNLPYTANGTDGTFPGGGGAVGRQSVGGGAAGVLYIIY